MGITRGGLHDFNDSKDFQGDKLENKLGKSAKIGGGGKTRTYISDPIPVYTSTSHSQTYSGHNSSHNSFDPKRIIRDIKYKIGKITPRKMIFPIGLILLIIIYFIANTYKGLFPISAGNTLSDLLLSTFTFGSYMDLIFILVLAISIVAFYKEGWFYKTIYGLHLVKRNGIFDRHRNRKIAKGLFYLLGLYVLVAFIKLNSWLGGFADWLIFLTLLFIMLSITFMLLMWINSFNLSSDLTAWLLRLFSGILLLGSGFMLFITAFSILYLGATSKVPLPVFTNLTWIFWGCILVIAIFGLFRANRRHAMVGYWFAGGRDY